MLLIQILVIALSISGVTLCYISSKHQRLLKHNLPMAYAICGVGALFVSLYGWLQILSPTAALFTWCFTIITLMISLPFLTLLSPKGRH